MNFSPAPLLRLAIAVTGLLATALATAPHAIAQDSDQAPAASARLVSAASAVRAADIAGTAWRTDPAAGTLVVTADRTVDAAGIARIEAAARHAGAPLELRRTLGRFAERIAGGDLIQGPNGEVCTVGFNVQDAGGTKYALTAGHCTAQTGAWSIGPVVGSSFPGNDYGLIEYTDPSLAEGGVRGPDGTLVDIVDARQPTVGQQVCAAGRTTGVQCGSVLGVNLTVDYGDGGIVDNLIDTNVCSEPGDSGGPLYSGHTAIGITSGGSGDCTSGGETFYQPVVEPLNAYGVTVF